VAALADPVWCVREAAAQAVGRLASPEPVLVERLIALTLTDPSPLVRLAAATAAGPGIDPQRHYGTAITHRFERQRARAATALGRVAARRAGEAAELLARSTRDSNSKVRLASLLALAHLDPTALLALVPLIVRRCAESDHRIARAARTAWNRALEAPECEPLVPLRPYPGTDNVLGVCMTLGALPADHPLAGALGELQTLPEEATDAARLARCLATVCARLLRLGTTWAG
jgi:hypothetical protein